MRALSTAVFVQLIFLSCGILIFFDQKTWRPLLCCYHPLRALLDARSWKSAHISSVRTDRGIPSMHSLVPSALVLAAATVQVSGVCVASSLTRSAVQLQLVSTALEVFLT